MRKQAIRNRIVLAVCIGVLLFAMVPIAGCGERGGGGLGTIEKPDYNGITFGYCTWYAAVEFDKVAPPPDKDWGGDAGEWYANAAARGWKETKEPGDALPGSIMVWGGKGFGHVAVFRSISGSTITFDEMNWGDWTDESNGITVNFGKTNTKTLDIASLDRDGGKLPFLGFILPIRR